MSNRKHQIVNLNTESKSRERTTPGKYPIWKVEISSYGAPKHKEEKREFEKRPRKESLLAQMDDLLRENYCRAGE